MAFKLRKLKDINLTGRLSEAYDKLEQVGIISWPVQAVALGYYCILGLVPFLALCFAVAKSFGLELALSDAIDRNFTTFDGQEEVLSWVKGFADNLISNYFNSENYSGIVMVFVALGIIFWSGYRILTLMETVFGNIFGYHPPRRVIHRLMDYFTVMVIVPRGLVAGGAINGFLSSLSNTSWNVPLGINPSRILSYLVIVSPYILWWLLMSWTYAYFSRGLIRWRERLIGGFVTGVVFQFFQAVYISIMFALTNYNAIYASFAGIPLFMIWLYLSWMIVLGGGEVTRRLSDLLVTGANFFSLVSPPTWCNTMVMCRRVLDEICRKYQADPYGSPTSFRHLSKTTKAPMPTLGRVINRLLAADLIVRLSGPSSQEGPSFLPARCPEQFTEKYVTEALENSHLEII